MLVAAPAGYVAVHAGMWVMHRRPGAVGAAAGLGHAVRRLRVLHHQPPRRLRHRRWRRRRRRWRRRQR
eukprot:2520676-Alexandrium_andersonii.AAC.1